MSLKESRKIFERPNKESVGTPKEFRLFKAFWSLRESSGEEIVLRHLVSSAKKYNKQMSSLSLTQLYEKYIQGYDSHHDHSLAEIPSNQSLLSKIFWNLNSISLVVTTNHGIP